MSGEELSGPRPPVRWVNTPTPVPSEVAETTAGERERCDRRGPGGECCRDHQPCPDFAAEPDAREVEEWEYALEGDWLVQVVNRHTCGTGPDGYYGAHEPGCGSIPVANIGPLLDRVRREEGAKVLREAAEALDTEEAAIDTALIGVDYVIQRLRDRAASVGRGEGL